MKNMVKGLEIKHLDIFADNAIKMIMLLITIFLIKIDGVLFIIIIVKNVDILLLK